MYSHPPSIGTVYSAVTNLSEPRRMVAEKLMLGFVCIAIANLTPAMTQSKTAIATLATSVRRNAR